MSILRRIVRFLGWIWGNPLPTLAVVILVIAGLNYKTLLAGLPGSVTDIEALVAEASPITVNLRGAVEGAEYCWEMQFDFLDRNGEQILSDRSYVGRLGQVRPDSSIAVPDLDGFQVKVTTRMISAEAVNHCVPTTALVVLSAAATTITTDDLVDQSRITNRCTRANNRFDCEVSIERGPDPAS